MSIGNKIKYLRKQNNLTQNELCGDYINRVILSRIESDKMLPSLEQLQYIARRLNKDTEYFISDKECTDNIYSKQSVKDDTIISKMYENEKYYEIVKKEDETYGITLTNNINNDYYVGMSYYKLGINHEAIKFLKKVVNAYLNSGINLKNHFRAD